MNFFRKKKALILGGAIALLSVVFISAQKSDFPIGKNLEILFNLFREVNMNYVDEIDPDRLMKLSAQGMLSELDPYTEFLPEEEMDNFQLLTTGKYGGIGSMIRQKGEWVEIAQPYRGFPADKAGLKIGDRILSLDGEDMRGIDYSIVSSKLKGDPGTTFKLTVERFRDGSVEELTLRRERISISGISYYGMVNDSVGVIVHDDFTDDCSTDVQNAIVDLKKQGMKALVLDYRNNGGGIMQEAVKIVGLFVPQGSEVVTMKGNRVNDVVQKTTSRPIDLDMPIAVLIGRNSASAAEIVAGALQDFDRAVLVGQRSFGKGLVQTTRHIGYNSYVKLTTAKYYIPSGRCIQAIDYSHRNDDGSVDYVPDSLIQEFKTRNGRKVYDGGGVMPDVLTESSEHYSLFTLNAYARGYLEEFALDYIRKNGFEPVELDTFQLSDEAYTDFIAFMADKQMDYESETRLALDALVKRAEREKYEELIAGEIEAIREKITKDKEEEVVRLRPEIAPLIEDDILLYFHYMQGVVQHKLRTDETLTEAAGVLADRSRYSHILASQDTQRNQ